MRKLLFALIVCLALTLSLNAQILVPQESLKSISPDEMKLQLEYFSSDEMKGRDTPSPELDTCAVSIASWFRECGLKKVGDNGTYFQYFNVLQSELDEPNTFVMSTAEGEKTFALKDDFIPSYFTANRKITAPVVFAGYGITAPEYGYDDYRNIDVTGKIAFIFMHEPQENDSASKFLGKKETEHSKLLNKALNARNHGASGLIVIMDPNNHRFIKPPNSWPSLMKNAPADAVPLTLEEKTENRIVSVRIGKALGAAILAPSGRSMEELQSAIDGTLTPQSFEIRGVQVTLETRLKFDRARTANVVGLLEGRDPVLKDEVVVYGAHYDHLGAQRDTLIYYGADDNASGTVGVMAMAKAFARAPSRPRRSVLFCAWSGEEKGLFGSRFYADNEPLIPAEKTVLYVNFDMIGRNDSSSVEVSGYESSDDLQPLTDAMNEDIGLAISLSKTGISRSDHVPFYNKKIPVLEFFTGFHDDYHRITDTADKCFPHGMAQIAKLAFKIGWTVANRDGRLSFKEAQK